MGRASRERVAGGLGHLRAELDWALAEAAPRGLVLGSSPSRATWSASRAARELLDEVGSAEPKIILDAANLIGTHGLARQAEIVAEAMELLGPDVALAMPRTSMLLEVGGGAGARRHRPTGVRRRARRCGVRLGR